MQNQRSVNPSDATDCEVLYLMDATLFAPLSCDCNEAVTNTSNLVEEALGSAPNCLALILNASNQIQNWLPKYIDDEEEIINAFICLDKHYARETHACGVLSHKRNEGNVYPGSAGHIL
ncbi:uncharacterized protein PADG_11998 [Paracoccidioides brasiliensis Pb18]|uniref:Uncharacterized protein n=1 Tax=Paracoccidioides brasiliensis (strain Pb18) TaxID=502780 RepID=A0A0A0HRN4_PARBD|nr:uncharacterized protein PADG_11998 [Paracoccidioides brasiliensis Pb18]KGM91859.1 hypothetical protein PADG_11998 [Paracoccidioides brasiliensis Pb18]